MRLLASLVDVQVDLVYPENPYGQVKHAKLVLRGPMLGCSWSTTEQGKPIAVIDAQDGLPIDFTTSAWEFDAQFDAEVPELSGYDEYALLGIIIKEPDSGLRNRNSSSVIMGLMLASRSARKDIWDRIGCFRIPCHGEWESRAVKEFKTIELKDVAII
jgi:hypothetical protein